MGLVNMELCSRFSFFPALLLRVLMNLLVGFSFCRRQIEVFTSCKMRKRFFSRALQIFGRAIVLVPFFHVTCRCKCRCFMINFPLVPLNSPTNIFRFASSATEPSGVNELFIVVDVGLFLHLPRLLTPLATKRNYF